MQLQKRRFGSLTPEKVKKAKSEEREKVKVVKAKSETFLKVRSLTLSQSRDSMYNAHVWKISLTDIL